MPVMSGVRQLWIGRRYGVQYCLAFYRAKIPNPFISKTCLHMLGERVTVSIDRGRPFLYVREIHKLDKILYCLRCVRPDRRRTIDLGKVGLAKYSTARSFLKWLSRGTSRTTTSFQAFFPFLRTGSR